MAPFFSILECGDCDELCTKLMRGPKPCTYEKKPSVFPMFSETTEQRSTVERQRLEGTCFAVKDDEENMIRLVSPSLPGKKCHCLVPVVDGFKKVDLNDGTVDMDYVVTDVQDSEITEYFQLNGGSDGKKVYMISRRARYGTCNNFWLRYFSKKCKVVKLREKKFDAETTYKKKNGSFKKDFLVGAPVVDEKNKVVGIVKSIDFQLKNFEVTPINSSDLN